MTGSIIEATLRLSPLPPHPVVSVDGDIDGLLGYSRETLQSGSVRLLSRVHPDDQDIVDAWLACPADGRTRVCNLRMRQANGRIRCLVAAYRLEAPGAGGQAELSLHLQDAKGLFSDADGLVRNASFRAMMDNTNDFIIFKDRNHVFTGASQTLVNVTQPARHWTDLVGQTDYDVFPEEYADIYYRLEKQVFAGHPVAQENQGYQTNDGTKGWVDNRKYPIRNQQGEITGLFGIARVITDRVLAERDLRQERETLQLILDCAPIGIWLQDGHGKIAFVNKAFCEATGIPEAQFLAVDHYIELIPEAFRPQCLASDAKALASDGISITHQRLPFADGQVHDLRVIKAVRHDALRQTTTLVGLSMDISEELRKEQALRQERDSTRNILATVEAMIVALDTEGRITLINRKGCQILGYSEAELIGRDWFSSCLPAELAIDQVRAVFKASLAGNLAGSEYFENPVLTRGGEQRLIAWHNSIIRDKDGGIIGGLSAGEDITERKQAEQALQASEEKYRELVDHAHSIILRWNTRGEVLFMNEYGQRFFGFSEAEIIGKSLVGSIVPAVDEAGQDLAWMLDEILRNPVKYAQNTNQNLRKDGTRVWVSWQNRPIMDAAGQVIGMLSAGTDFTELRASQQEIQLRDRYQRALLDNFPFMVWLKDTDSRLLAANQTYADTAGVATPDDLTGKTDLDLFPRELAEAYLADDQEVLLSGKPKSVEEPMRFQDKTLWIETYKSPVILDGKTIGTVGFARDISERKAHQKQLEHIAHYDILTGLPNRVLLADRLHQALAQAQRHKTMLAVAYLDLDGFKAINDEHGHEVGDHLLTALAGHMKHALRDGDTLSRLGGDEFVAVLLDLPSIESCVPMLSRLLSAASEVVHEQGKALRVSASLGVTFYPQSETLDADQLLRQADQAMYQAKLAGKNRYHIFDTELDRSVRGRHEGLENIRKAMDEHEFVLYYQPKVNMRTGQVIGVEALIRWQHPERGLLPPAAFLPVIANHSLSIELGEWVLDSAMTQVEVWKAGGLRLPVSVNIDALQLEQADFVERLQHFLARHGGIAPGDLELEVLETSALEELAHVSAVIQACRQLGVSFALDDFGTGYSSLTYLKRLPAGMLKVDQSFVRDMFDDPDDLAILEGVLGLATAFRRQAIAEGVETLAHGKLLLQLGCELGQGYVIARPMPPEAIPAWLNTWRPDPSWLNGMPVSRDQLPIMFASVEHRAWVSHIAQYLHGNRDSLPPLDRQHCRFSDWLRHDARSRFLDHPALKAIEPLHDALHDRARELVGLKHQGRSDTALERLSELYSLRDSLLDRLMSFLD